MFVCVLPLNDVKITSTSRTSPALIVVIFSALNFSSKGDVENINFSVLIRLLPFLTIISAEFLAFKGQLRVREAKWECVKSESKVNRHLSPIISTLQAPKLIGSGIDVKFNIIGQTSYLLKFRLHQFKNVRVYNNVKSHSKFCKNVICGISNIDVATGIQNKILEYMRLGIPAVVSKKCFESLTMKKNNDLLVYENYDDLVKLILKLKKNKNFSQKISLKAYRKIFNYYSWEKKLIGYDNLI